VAVLPGGFIGFDAAFRITTGAKIGSGVAMLPSTDGRPRPGVAGWARA